MPLQVQRSRWRASLTHHGQQDRTSQDSTSSSSSISRLGPSVRSTQGLVRPRSVGPSCEGASPDLHFSVERAPKSSTTCHRVPSTGSSFRRSRGLRLFSLTSVDIPCERHEHHCVLATSSTWGASQILTTDRVPGQRMEALRWMTFFTLFRSSRTALLARTWTTAAERAFPMGVLRSMICCTS